MTILKNNYLPARYLALSVKGVHILFNGNILRDAILSAANNIGNNRKAVDDLNVFPVPDGDTGTNMSMTLANSVRELEKLEGATAGKVANCPTT